MRWRLVSCWHAEPIQIGRIILKMVIRLLIEISWSVMTKVRHGGYAAEVGVEPGGGCGFYFVLVS